MHANTSVRLVLALLLVLSGVIGLWQTSSPGLITGLFVFSDEMVFVSPTPDNDSMYNTPNLTINVSVTGNITNATLDWNGNNLTMAQSGNFFHTTVNNTGTFTYRVYAWKINETIATVAQTVKHGWVNLTELPNRDVAEDNALIFGLWQYVTSNSAKDALTYNISLSNNKAICSITDYNLSCISQPNVSGKVDITLSVQDGPVSKYKTFTLNITEVNDPPIQTQAFDTYAINEQNKDTADMDKFFSDADGDTLTYHVVNNSIIGSYVQGDLLWMIPLDVGSTNLNVTIHDNTTNISVLIPINVTENHPPVPYANGPSIINWTENNVGSVRLTSIFYDPDGDKLTYNITNVEGITVSLSSKTAYFIPDVGVTGDKVVTVTANDGQFKISKPLTLRIIASGATTPETNSTPVVAPAVPEAPQDVIPVSFAPITWMEDSQTTLELTPTIPMDTLPSPLTTVSGLNRIKFAINPSSVTFNPDPDFFGSETATIKVVDGSTTYEGTIQLTVQNTEDALLSMSLPSIVLNENKTSMQLDLSEYFTDPDGENLEFDVQADGLNVTFKSKSVVIFSMAGSGGANISARIIAKASNGRELSKDMLVAFVDAVKTDSGWATVLLQALLILLLLSLMYVGTYKFKSRGNKRMNYITKTIDQVYEDPEMRRVLKAQAQNHPKAVPVEKKLQENARKAIDKLFEAWQGLTGNADARIQPNAFRNEILYIKETISSIRAIMSSTQDLLIKAALDAEKKRLMRAYHALQGKPELDRDTMRKLLLYSMESASALQEIAAVSEDTLITYEVRKQARRMRKVMNSVQYKLESSYKK